MKAAPPRRNHKRDDVSPDFGKLRYCAVLPIYEIVVSISALAIVINSLYQAFGRTWLNGRVSVESVKYLYTHTRALILFHFVEKVGLFDNGKMSTMEENTVRYPRELKVNLEKCY